MTGRRSFRRSGPLGATVGLILALAACGSSGGASLPPTTRVPLPAGIRPSDISKMVCSGKAQQELASPLGVTAAVTTPSWTDHMYACTYRYADGSFTLSIKELSSWTETFGYFDGLGRTLGHTGAVKDLGQGAFTTDDGSIVVRKDWKVLLVDISGLPAQFGVPATSRGDVAFTIADVILGCWAGD
jgi:hypothetical protein